MLNYVNSKSNIKTNIEEDFNVIIRMFKLLYIEKNKHYATVNFNTLTKIDDELLHQLQTVLDTPTNDINILYEILTESVKECENHLITIDKQIAIKLNNHIKHHLEIITTFDNLNKYEFLVKDELFIEKETYIIALKSLKSLKTSFDEFLINNVLTIDKIINQINIALNSIFGTVKSNVINEIFIDYVDYIFTKLKSLIINFQIFENSTINESDNLVTINRIKQLILAFINNTDYIIITEFIFSIIDTYEMIKIKIIDNKINYTKYKINFIKAPDILLTDDELELHTEIVKACKYNLQSFTITASNGITLPIVVTNLIEKFNIIDALYRHKVQQLKSI